MTETWFLPAARGLWKDSLTKLSCHCYSVLHDSLTLLNWSQVNSLCRIKVWCIRLGTRGYCLLMQVLLLRIFIMVRVMGSHLLWDYCGFYPLPSYFKDSTVVYEVHEVKTFFVLGYFNRSKFKICKHFTNTCLFNNNVLHFLILLSQVKPKWGCMFKTKI